MSIVDPIFRWVVVLCHSLTCMEFCMYFTMDWTLRLDSAVVCHRDFGGTLRFSGRIATVKCFENNPLVRKVRQVLR